MDARFERVIEVKRQSHRSWKNFYSAANKLLGLPYSFGTDKVKQSSMSRLSAAINESGLSASEIKAEIEERGLLQ